MDGLPRSVARTMEQALICTYTLEALGNARYEIAEKNYEAFSEEMSRVASLLKVPGSEALKTIITHTRKVE